MAHAAGRGLVWTGRWRGAVSGVACQFRIGGSVHFPAVPRIISLRTPNKSGLWREANRWVVVSTKWCLTRVGSERIVSTWIGG